MKRKRRTKAELVALDAALVDLTAQSRPATVRQIYYLATVHGWADKNEKGYDLIQRRLKDLREIGRVPYRWIVDGSRTVYGHARSHSLEDYTREVAGRYRKDYWAESDEHVQIWIEKDALAGVLRPMIVNEFGLDLHVCRGFSSITYLQEAAEEIAEDDRQTYVYILTDFDPSGASIAETVEDDLLARVAGCGEDNPEPVIEHLAVTQVQTAELAGHGRLTKASDSRAKAFIARYGPYSYELDAIPPDELRNIVRAKIEGHMDREHLRVLKMVEKEEREGLAQFWRNAS